MLTKSGCACGVDHSCNIKYVYIEDGAVKKLKTILKDFSSVLVVADENTFGACGQYVLNSIGNKAVKKVVFSGKEVLIPNEIAIKAVQEKIDGTGAIVGIGSGVIQDLCKYISSISGIPYVIVATAPSMDGYASDGAAMITDGMKVTYKATVPLAIIAEPETLKDAPFEMIQAGYGDIIGKYSALNDWKLAKVVKKEYFCDYVYGVTFDMIKKVIDCADGLVKRDKNSVKTLMEALILVGIMMSFVGTSRPASGSEHHMAHFFEITGIIDNKPYLPHGIDVGCSTVVTAMVREQLLNSNWSFITRDDAIKRAENLNKIYKTSAQKCQELQAKIGNYDESLISIYLEKEEEIKSILREMPSSKEIELLLDKVGIDLKGYFELYGREKIENAVTYSKDLKDRYTVFWLYYYLTKKEK